MKVHEDQQRAKAIDLGVPFWLESEAFNGLAKLPSLQHWSWQFFRRNHEYRKFYADRLGPFFREESVDNPVNELQKFGVMLAGDPTNMDVDYIGLTLATLTEYRPAPRGMHSDYTHDPERILYQFDLNKNIDDQLAVVRRDLKLKQNDRNREFRASLNRYPEYIRVLDALDVGATQSEIAKVMFPSHSGGVAAARQNVQDFKKAAFRLRDNDYFVLYTKAAGLNGLQTKKDKK